MTDAIAPVSASRKWLKRLLKLFAGLVVLLIVLYFFATSAFFLRHFILPSASKSLGAEITVDDASISPFSHVELHGVKVQTAGSEPLATVQDVKLVYSLREILSGNIHVDEVTVNSPVIDIVNNPDGTSNLDPLLKKSSQSSAASSSKPAESKTSTAPPKINIVKVALNNATVRQTKIYAGGTRDTSVISNLTITLDNLQNGQTAKLTLAAGMAVDNHPPAPGTNASLQATLNGNFSAALAADLKPASITGNLKLDVPRAAGALADLSGIAATLNCDVSPTNINQLALQFEQAGANIGQVRVSGPLDLQKMEGRLTLEIPSIDRRVLALAAAGTGLDFGPARLSSSNVIQIAKGGKSIIVDGQFNAVSLALSQNGQTVPTLDFHANYGVTYDGEAGAVQLRKLALSGLQNQGPLLRVDLTSPLQISLGNPGISGSSELNLAITNFNLAQWKPFLGSNADGNIALNLDLISNPAGQHLQVAVNGRAGGLVFDHFQTAWDVNATMTNHVVHVTKASGSVRQGTGAGGSFDFTADYDLAKNAGQFTAKIADLNQNALSPFLDPALAGQKLVSITINADASGSINAQGDSSIKGQFKLANLVVHDPVKNTNLPALSIGLDVDAGQSKKVVEIRQLQLALSPTTRASNALSLSGKVDLTKSDAIQGNLKLASDGIDLTHYYDLFIPQPPPADKNKPAPVQPAAAPANASPATVPVEPAPINLPCKDFTFAGDIKQLYLHEIAISNWQFTTKLDGAKVSLNPFQLNLNGAPVKATVDADLSKAGYKYDVTFSAQSIPLTPIVDTFSPNLQGKVNGDLIASAQITGIGITQPSLKKNLSGRVDVLMTNGAVDLSIGKWSQRLIIPVVNTIFFALNLPDVSHSALAVAAVDAKVGSGTVDISQLRLVADDFVVNSQGTFTLADVMTNSTINDLPVNLGLPVNVAKKAGLAPANVNTNIATVDLGRLATVGGTFGSPDPKVDKLAIGKIAGKVIVDAAGHRVDSLVGGNAGKAINGVKGITSVLTGSSSTNTSTNGTNSNLIEKSGNLLRGILGR